MVDAHVEAIIKQIADGIDAAARQGVKCAYPTLVEIDGQKFEFEWWLLRARESHDG